MSLINEALKKAQRQRTEEAAPATSSSVPGTAAVPVARIAKHRPAMPARTLVVLIGGGASLLIMACVFVFVFFIGDSEPAAPHAKPVVAAVPAPVAPNPAPAPASVTPSPETVAPPEAPVVSVLLPPVVAPAPAPSPAPAPEPVVVAPAVPQPTPAPAPVVVAPRPRDPVANPAVYEFLEKLRVSGVRASATDPKVIMNDRVYRLNDLVDKPTQLRLIRVENFTLIFSDASGFEYRKTL